MAYREARTLIAIALCTAGILILAMISIGSTKNHKLIMENGVSTQAQLLQSKRITPGHIGGKGFSTLFLNKSRSIYGFRTSTGEERTVSFTTISKSKVTNSKTIYYLPENPGLYTFEDSNQFEWILEIILEGLVVVPILGVLVFFNNRRYG